MINIYIMLAGEATRWGNYLGVPKHFAPVHTFGPAIENTIQKLQRHLPEAVIYCIVKDAKASPYKELTRLGVSLLEARLEPSNGDADKLLSSSYHWKDKKDDTIVFIWGDSWLTESCVSVIAKQARAEHEAGWHAVARWDGNPFTGSPGGENFAHIVKPNGFAHYWESLERIANLYKNGIISRNGGWELYKALKNLPDEKILVWWADGTSSDNPFLGDATQVIDGSEDFDAPADWDAWHWNFHNATPEKKWTMVYG